MKVAGFVLSLLLSATTGAAFAAPQILGVVAADEAVPMQCGDGICTALLSAFCLQNSRLPPEYDTAYAPIGPGSVTILVTAASGRTERLDASGLVEFRTRDGFTTLEARLDLRRLRHPSPIWLALEIGPLAAALPVPLPGDTDPLTVEEISLAAGPLREASEAIFEGKGDTARAARLTARLINRLPRDGDIESGLREQLWDRVADSDAPPLARAAFDACIRTVDESVGYTLRECLQDRHRALQIDNTRDFRNLLGDS